MRFAESGYYIEKYVKCENCGVLVYHEGVEHPNVSDADDVFCSQWCVAWYDAKQRGEENPQVGLEFDA
ncbi:MAG: hypothetical protein ACPHUF_11810 [Gammaproteobacteria bacterium]